MALFRRKPRSRIKTSPQKWQMRRRRSRGLRLRQLAQGKVIVSFGIVAIIALCIYGVFFTETFHVFSVQVATEYKDINTEKLKNTISKKFVGENSLFLDLTAIQNYVFDRFPEVSYIDCDRKFFSRSLACEAIGYELVAVIKHEGKKYYINENGVVIAYDSRKLGLPIFDLILNPVYADFPLAAEILVPEDPIESEPVLEPVPQPGSLTESILAGKDSGKVLEEERPEEEKADGVEDISSEELPELAITDPSLKFIQPFETPPIEPVIQNEAREVFRVAVGKKILDPEELKLILEAITELEEVLVRKVIHAQYVQVAGELSLTSKPAQNVEKEEGTEEEDDNQSEEDPEHELTFLLDLRRNLAEQFVKLKKFKEVIDFTEISRIDLSVDGEKVFYR